MSCETWPKGRTIFLTKKMPLVMPLSCKKFCLSDSCPASVEKICVGEVGVGDLLYYIADNCHADFINLYHSLGKFSRQQIREIFFYIFQEIRIWHFMQIVSTYYLGVSICISIALCWPGCTV